MPKKQTPKFFNQADAQSKLGQCVRARIELPGVPRGTEGTVIHATEEIRGNARYCLMVEWNIPTQSIAFNNRVLAALAGGYNMNNTSRLTRQQFNKADYERCLWEIEPPK